MLRLQSSRGKLAIKPSPEWYHLTLKMALSLVICIHAYHLPSSQNSTASWIVNFRPILDNHISHVHSIGRSTASHCCDLATWKTPISFLLRGKEFTSLHTFSHPCCFKRNKILVDADIAPNNMVGFGMFLIPPIIHIVPSCLTWSHQRPGRVQYT